MTGVKESVLPSSHANIFSPLPLTVHPLRMVEHGCALVEFFIYFFFKLSATCPPLTCCKCYSLPPAVSVDTVECDDCEYVTPRAEYLESLGGERD